MNAIVTSTPQLSRSDFFLQGVLPSPDVFRIPIEKSNKQEWNRADSRADTESPACIEICIESRGSRIRRSAIWVAVVNIHRVIAEHRVDRDQTPNNAS